MQYRVTFGPMARADLLKLFEELCLNLSTMPERGTARFDLRPGLRTIGFERKATIAFRVKGDSVAILRILYRGRSLEKALGFHHRRDPRA